MPSYVEDAEPDAQLSRGTPERTETDQPAEQTSTLGRKPLPGTALPQRLRIVEITLVQIDEFVYRKANQVGAGLFSRKCTGVRLNAVTFFHIRKKAHVQGGVTRRELAENGQGPRNCWFRAPRHYSASLSVVTRALR